MSRPDKPRRFDGLILTGEEIGHLYQADLEQGKSTQAELYKRYGKELWFLKTPNYPPPLHYYKSEARDTLGRGYCVCSSDPMTVFIQLQRSPAYAFEDVP